jgi:PAS domain S-box-containing protein
MFWVTPRVLEIFGYQQQEKVSLERFAQSVHADDLELVRQAMSDSFEKRVATSIEYRILTEHNVQKWIYSSGRPHFDNQGTPTRLLGISIDISKQKSLEDELKNRLAEVESLKQLLEHENTILRSEVGLDEGAQFNLGISSSIRVLTKRIEQVACTDSTVLIQGETGTGKELVAQTIHRLSERGKRLMVTVNCAALPAALVESELFGREKGAFTGALSRQVGRFELADGSTLFLDEIAEMPLETQAKLLRVLQEGQIERLGSPQSIKVDVRILAATNRNLAEEVENGRFRRDLFYRLNVFPINVPPLRERVEDIPQLTWKFVNEFGQRMGRKISRIASSDMEALRVYSWPGNIRELRNAIEHALIVSKGDTLNLSQFAPSLPLKSKLLSLKELEYQHILEILKITHGRIKGKGGAAELLGLNSSTLYSRMRKLNINPASF